MGTQATENVQITITLPESIRDSFLGWMSAAGEKYFAEAYADDHSESFVGFKYPDWHNQIVIEEHLYD